MLQKTFAENPKRFRHSGTQAFADTCAFLFPFLAPSLPDGVFRRLFALSGAAGVQQAPYMDEFAVSLPARKQPLEVDLQVTGAGQRGCVAQQSHTPTVANDSPQGAGADVQQFLCQLEGGFLAPVSAVDLEAHIGLVQPQGMRRDDDGHMPGDESHRILPFAHDDVADFCQIAPAQSVAQPFPHEIPRDGGGIDVGAPAPGLEMFPLRHGNLESAALFFPARYPFG